MINICCEDINFDDFDSQCLQTTLARIIKLEDFREGEISYILCSDDYLININRQFLNHNYNTDVIAFPAINSDIISGDIFINVHQVHRNADKYNTTMKNEFYRVCIHGLLHLMGFTDYSEEERKIMKQKENLYLQLFSEP